MKFLLACTLLAMMASACNSPRVQPIGEGRSLISQKDFDPNWDKWKAEIRELLYRSHGIGLLFAIERVSATSILFSYAREGDSVSKHRMIVSHLEPGSTREVEHLDLMGSPGTAGSGFKLIQETWEVPAAVKTLKIIFAVGVAGEKTAMAVIPEVGANRKVYYLFIPEP